MGGGYMRYSMFVGRFQPFHDGHRWLIEQRLKLGKKVGNDVELFLNLKNRVKKTCDKYDVELLELYGVVFA